MHDSSLSMASIIIFIILQLFTIIFNPCNAQTKQKFPALLIFGDSTVDTGNNNYITTVLKANHYPYGKDFPGHISTGRFSNGKLPPDILASSLGIKDTIPPFLRPNLSVRDLRTGVNFASAGSGFDELTNYVSQGISMSKQIGYFKSYVERLEGVAGKEEGERIVREALVFVSTGSNDLIMNFYSLLGVRRIFATIDAYQDFILTNIHSFILELYNLGCRKIFVMGLPPIGCLPIQITGQLSDLTSRDCVKEQNLDAQSYNKKLVRLLSQIQASLEDSTILYGDIYKPLMNMIQNPQQYGFNETRRGCCGTGLVEGGPICLPISPICANTSQYVFFDSMHPTELAYYHITKYVHNQILDKL